MTPHCCFDLQDSKSIFSTDTPVHDDVSLCKVLFQTFVYFRNHLDKYILKFWTFALNREHSHPLFQWTLWLMMIYHQARFACKRISSSIDIAETDMFPFIWALLDCSCKWILSLTHQLLMTQLHSMFDYKRLSGLLHVINKIIYEYINHCCDQTKAIKCFL